MEIAPDNDRLPRARQGLRPVLVGEAGAAESRSRTGMAGATTFITLLTSVHELPNVLVVDSASAEAAPPYPPRRGGAS